MNSELIQRLAKITAVPCDAYQQEDNDLSAVMFKLIIIGNTGVGKSCLLTQLTKGEFRQEHTVTIGVEFGNCSMTVNDEVVVKLQIWDTAGQESFRSITRIFYKGSHAVFLTFDITNYQSFKDILDWQQEIENNADEGIIKYLVGNFADLEDERQVSKEEAEQLVKKLGFHHYVETSAFTGQNVGLLFETLTKHLFVANEFNLNEFRQPVSDDEDDNVKVKLTAQQQRKMLQPKKKQCC